MTMTRNPAASFPPRQWSMTPNALIGLRARAEQLTGNADRTGGFLAAQMSGEPDAPTFVPNVDGQRMRRQLGSVRSALAVARVEPDVRVAVIGRRATLEGTDGGRMSYALVIPGDGDLANGEVSADSPVGRAIYGRAAGDEIRVDAPDGAWTATVLSVE